jgi:site-specific recombinase XerD
MTAEDYLRVVDVEKVRGSSLPRGRALEPQELERLYQACAADPTPAGARDGAAIALMHAAGLRKTEVVLLDVEAVDLRTGAVTVHGKGRKQRITYLGVGAPWVEAWLAVRGSEPGPLMLEVRSGEILEHRLSQAAIYDAVTKRARQAGIEQCGPHDLRRTFATELLDAGADIALVQQLLGHSSVQTTTIYDRRGEAAKVAAQRRLRIPQPGGLAHA